MTFLTELLVSAQVKWFLRAFLLIYLALDLALTFWVYRDSKKRYKNDTYIWAFTILTFLLNFIGLTLYLLIRPVQTQEEAKLLKMEKILLLQNLKNNKKCSNCQNLLQEGFVFCPYCEEKIRETCPDCKKALNPEWGKCPYCGSNLSSTKSKKEQKSKQKGKK